MILLFSNTRKSFGQQENQPILLTPFNEQKITSEAELRSTIFSWTGTQSDFGYQLAFYPVYPCQDPLTAFRVNHPIYVQFAGDEFFFLTENMNFNDGTYVWSVTTQSNENHHWSPPSIFVLETGNGSGIFIETGNPCDTPAGCAQIAIEPEKEIPLDFMASKPNGDQFLYPRALPVVLDGKDYDKVTFRCKGCGAEDGTEVQYVEDRVSNYKWELMGKGSLGDAFKRKRTDSLQAEIEKLNAKIDNLISEIKTKQNRLDKGIDEEIEENSKRIDRLNKQLNSLDSIDRELDKTRDSLTTVKDELISKLVRKRTSLKNKTDSIVELQQRIDTLNGLLSGRFSNAEAPLLTEIERLNEQYENLSNEIESAEIDLKTQLQEQDLAISQLEAVVRSKSNQYNNLRIQIETVTQRITSINNQLYANKSLYDYAEARNNWRMVMFAFDQRYSVKNYSNLFQQVEDAAQKVALPSSNRNVDFNTFLNLLNNLMNESQTAFQKSNNQDDAFKVLQQSSKLLKERLDSLRNTTITLDGSLLNTLKAEQDKLVSFEGQSASLEAELKGAEKQFQKAQLEVDKIIQNFESKIEKLAEKKNLKLVELTSAQQQLKSLTMAREAKTAQNKISYLEEIETKDLDKLKIQLTLADIYEDIIKLQGDSTVIVREIKFVDADKRSIGQQKEVIRSEIERLEADNKRLEEEKNSLGNELKDLNKELSKLQKEREALIGNLEESTKAMKTAQGPIVYYIPPTLDELLKGSGKEAEFKRLVNAVEAQKDSLKLALKAKENLQQVYTQMTVDVAKELLTLKEIETSLEKIEKDIAKATKTLQDQTFEAGKRIRNSREEEAKKREALEAKKKENAEKIEELIAAKKDLEKKLKQQRELVEKNDSLLSDIKAEIRKKEKELLDEAQNESQRKSNIADNTQKLRAKKQEETRLIQQIGQKRNAITLASAQDNLAGIASNQKALNQLEKDLEKVREDVRFYVTELGIMAQNLKEIRVKQTQLNAEIKTQKDRIQTIQLNHFPNIDQLRKMINEFDEKSANLKECKKDDLKLQAVDVDSAVETANVDSLMNKDEKLQKAKASVSDLTSKKEKLEKDKERGEQNIATIIDEKKKKKTSVEAAVKKAEEDLKKARKELKDFIDGEFERATFDTKIKIIGDDDVIDQWRSNDDAKIKVITLSYKNRVPFINDNLTIKKPSNEKEPSGCFPIIKTDVGEAPDVTAIVPGNEPRTLALLYENGKLLYDKWPVIPDSITDILAKDVVITNAGLKEDIDQLAYQCISAGESEEEKLIRIGEDMPAGNSSESTSRPTTGGTGETSGDASATGTRERGAGNESSSESGSSEEGGEGTETPEEEEEFCASLAGLNDPIIDLGRFTFIAKNIVGANTKDDIGIFLWEPEDIAKDLPQDKLDIEVKYKAADLYEDEEVGLLKKVLVKAGIMIETTDTVRGSPKGKSAITTRIVRGNHRGLIGEEIRLTATSIYGNSTDFGFDANGTKTISLKTGDGGYLKDAFFYYGKEYDAFTIKVEWIRGGNTVDEQSIYAETPLLHNYRLLAYQINELTLKKALNLVEGEKVPTAAEITAIQTKDKGNYLFYGTQNFDKSFANALELSFEVEGKTKVDPEKATTTVFGIAWTVLKDAPKNEQFDVTSKTEVKYKEISKEHEASGKVDTDKIKRFKIGSSVNPFVITLQQEASPGETIKGKANIDIDGLSTELEVLNVLKDIELSVEDVQVEKRGEDFIATAGKVTYTSSEGKKFTALSSFDFTLTTFGVTAGAGGILIGTVKHEKLKEAVNFEAEIDPAGNFLGKLSNLPEIEVKEFKLKKGASVVLDMHSDRSKDVIPYKGAFYGIVIQQATLELPKSFNKKDVKEATTISVQDFYISKEGFGGTIESKGQLLSAGFSGYECRINTVKVKFERSELKEGSFGGNVVLPSPMEGEVGISITAATNKFAGELSTDKPIQLPQFKTTFVLRKAALSYDFDKELGTLELGALINSDKFGDVSIDGFVLKSNGEIKADSIKVEKDIEIGAGFKMNLRKIGFAFKDRSNYAINFDGKVDLKGILAIDAKAKVKSGPSLTFDELKVDFDKGPMKFAGSFTYQAAVFQGNFDVKLKKCNKGLNGFVIVGSQKISKASSFTYWYGELSSSVAIPIAQTGFSFLEFGGGVGYNYIPPLGSATGSPLRDGGFSLKALVGIGNVPTGELIAGRMEMSYISGQISLFGTAWALTKEESMYGEGRINIVLNDNPKVDGYIAALLGLPDAKGKVFIARGKMNFSYPPNAGRYIWTENVNASLLQTLNANAYLVISENDVHMKGNLTYDVEKSVSIGVVTLNASFDLNAGLDLRYVYKTSTGTVRPVLNGNWDVNAEAFSKTYDILSGSVVIQDAELKITPSQVSITGYASAQYKIPFYQGTKEVRIDYTAAL